jgi:hypothetical protein
MLMGVHKTQRMTLAFVRILEQYHKDGSKFPDHIVQIKSDETWVSLVNVETEE